MHLSRTLSLLDNLSDIESAAKYNISVDDIIVYYREDS